MKSYAMRFISGKYQGGEFPLPADSQIVVGRSSELDMVLVEDMVSRRHAKIAVTGDHISIEDLGSTNGTFVNGERIRQADLSDGDRVLIGTSIIKLVTAEVGAPATVEPPRDLQQVADNRRSNQVRSMSGAIDDVPLPDLLQLFGSSRKTGVLVIRTDTDEGRVHLDQGTIVDASVNDAEILSPQQAVYRILAWRHGTFYLEPAEAGEHPEKITMAPEAALMEGMRIIDEMSRCNLPPMRAELSVPSPLTPRLRDLTPEQLDVFQVAMQQTQLEAVFNNSGIDDIVLAGVVAELLESGYLKATEPG